MSTVIDLNCIKKEQERFSKHLETTKSIISQNEKLKLLK
ncbi:hypothetical protein UMC2_23891 [[Clostridium] sordellii]|nr:hypothetical protein UMC2_23891 [[Clostridium] sordellii] [Paeniclostridium sordellii]